MSIFYPLEQGHVQLVHIHNCSFFIVTSYTKFPELIWTKAAGLFSQNTRLTPTRKRFTDVRTLRFKTYPLNNFHLIRPQGFTCANIHLRIGALRGIGPVLFSIAEVFKNIAASRFESLTVYID